MVKKMSADYKILEELRRYNQINNYIYEQEALDVPPPADAPPEDPLGGADPAAGALPPPPGGVAPTPPAEPTPIDPATDPDVEKIGPEGETEEKGSDDSEELDITDLVTSQQNIESKQEEYFNNLFGQLETLQSKLGEMDKLVSKIDSLEAKVDK